MMQAGDEAILRRRWWILAFLSLSLVIITLDNSILNVALPTLVRDLQASTSELQWIVDSYTLVFAGFLLAAGGLSDRYGRKKGLLIGLLVFGVGSFLSSIAGTAAHLIATRSVMGFGAAFIMPATLSILTNVFPAEERGRAIGIWAAMAGVGVPLGPILGGLLLEHFSWGAIFLVNVPLVSIALIAGLCIIPDSRSPDASPPDPSGLVLSIASIMILVYATIEAPRNGWSSTLTVILFVAAAVLLGLFIARETHISRPMIDLAGLFRKARFSAASLAVALVFFSLFGSLFILTQYLQSVLGYSPLEAGIRLVPAAIGISIGAPLSSRVAERIGAKIPVSLGLGLAAGGLALLSTASASSGYHLVLYSLLLFGSGMGLAMSSATNSIMGSVPPQSAGVAAGVNTASRQVGGAFGVAVLGSILLTTYRASLSGHLAGLPPASVEAIRSSVGAAREVSSSMGGPSGATLAQSIDNAFISGMDTALLVASLVALTGALVALVFLPAFGDEPSTDSPRSRRALHASEGEAGMSSGLGVQEPEGPGIGG